MKKMRITLVGAGRLATNLAAALKSAGYELAQIYSRTEESAKALAERIGCGYCHDIGRIDPQSDTYIIAVKDDAIAEMSDKLRPQNKEAVVLHTSGSTDMSALAAHPSRGVLYPLQTFSKQRSVDFKSIPLFIEASNPETLGMVTEIAGRLSERVFPASSQARLALHVAAVFACNFTNHMYDIAAHLTHEHGIPFEVLTPLIEETALKIRHMPPHEAQTGPAARGDERILSKHLAFLDQEPGIKHLYETLSKSIQHGRNQL